MFKKNACKAQCLVHMTHSVDGSDDDDNNGGGAFNFIISSYLCRVSM